MRSLRPRAGMIRAALTAAMAVVLLASAIGPIAPARAGDPLTDALRQQKTLRAKIATQQRELKALKASEAKLSARLAATQGALNEINADQANVRARIKEASTALAEVRASYKVLVRRVDELTWQLEVLEDDMAQGEEQLATSKRILARHIADAYKTQQTSLLEQLLTASSLSDVLEDVGYYLASGDQDARLASQIERDQAELDRLRRSIAATRTETQRTRMQVKAQYNEMVRQRDELKSAQERLEELEAQTREAKAKQLTAYNAIRKNKSQTAATLAKEKAALDDLQAQISKLIARDMGNIPSVYSGSLLWPLSGTVTQSFGCSGFALEPSRGGCGHYHNGIDIAAPMYSPIRAAGDGVVVFAGANPYDPPGARAWIVVIAHSRSLVTWYAHVDNGSRPPAVHKGQWVNQGQVIAYVGMTGRTTGPHLHWMVELHGVFSNPRLFV
jgi:murein DD-endopeptidase MepM/ murein hydrolase activator NlpD